MDTFTVTLKLPEIVAIRDEDVIRICAKSIRRGEAETFPQAAAVLIDRVANGRPVDAKYQKRRDVQPVKTIMVRDAGTIHTCGAMVQRGEATDCTEAGAILIRRSVEPIKRKSA